MQPGIAGYQRAPLPMGGINHAIGGLEPKARRAIRALAEGHPEVTTHRHLLRARQWIKGGHGWLRGRQRIRPNPQIGREGGDQQDAAKAKDDSSTPAHRLDRLLLLKEVHDSDVEALTDGDRTIVALLRQARRSSSPRTELADACTQALPQLHDLGRCRERWRQAGERLQEQPLSRHRVGGGGERPAVGVSFNLANQLVDAIPLEGLHASFAPSNVRR